MIYLNGKFVSENRVIQCNDRGLLLADGVFETLFSSNHQVHHLSYHVERLKKSAEFLGLPWVMSVESLNEILFTLLRLNQLERGSASIRITLTRGPASRGIGISLPITPTLLMSASPLNQRQFTPIRLHLSAIRRNEYSPLSQMKTLGYLDNILGRREALKHGFEDCLFLNTKGNVTCTSVANVFIISNSKVMTPRVEDGVLPGVTRRVLIELCQENQIPIEERSLSLDDLSCSEEIFITNSLMQFTPILEIEGVWQNKSNKFYKTQRLQEQYQLKLHANGVKPALV